MTIAEFQRLYREGKVSSEEATVEALEKIVELNDRYRAILEINPDALFIARALDEEAKKGFFRGPLHGVPMVIKGNIDTADKMETTAGALALKGNRPKRDAFLVEKLRRAGVVVVGKANLTEMANFVSFDMPNGFSYLGGQTKNARGDFDVGGSSSGSAVAVALGMALGAIGTETSGSILSPSSSNGIVGHKPTTGTISRRGIVPISYTQDTAGPMALTVEDAFLIFQELIGYDPEDPATHAFRDYRPKFERIESYSGMKFGYSEQFLEHVPKDHVDIFHESLKIVEKLGGKIVKVEFPHLDEIKNIDVLLCEFPIALADYLKDKDISHKTLDDLIAFNNANPRAVPYGQSVFLLSSSFRKSTECVKALLRDREFSREKGIDMVMNENDLDALLFPANYGALITAKAGYPSITVPAGFSEEDGPFGLTFNSTALKDDLLYSIADVFFRERSLDILKEIYGTEIEG